jgi:hypothetical protein
LSCCLCLCPAVYVSLSCWLCLSVLLSMSLCPNLYVFLSCCPCLCLSLNWTCQSTCWSHDTVLVIQGLYLITELLLLWLLHFGKFKASQQTHCFVLTELLIGFKQLLFTYNHDTADTTMFFTVHRTWFTKLILPVSWNSHGCMIWSHCVPIWRGFLRADISRIFGQLFHFLQRSSLLRIIKHGNYRIKSSRAHCTDF